MHEDLLDLPRVGLDPAQCRVQFREQVDVLADHTPEYLLRVCHHSIGVQNRWLQYLPAAEGEKLASERGSPVGSVLDVLEVPAHWIVRADVLQKEPRIAGDDRQQVVEIMCHSARQSSHRLHLLRLAELLFQGPTLGHVLDDELEASRAAGLVHQAPAERNRDLSTVFTLPEDFRPLQTILIELLS